MLVYRKEDLDAIKKGIAEELKNNPEFESVFDFNTSRVLFDIENGYRRTTRRGIDVTVSEDGKSIQIREPMDIANNTSLPYTEMRGHEINLTENGQMEVISAYGRLIDARKYYQFNPSMERFTNADSLLSTNYTYSRYEPNGIQISYGTYDKFNWSLTRINYTEEDKFATQLYSKGWHMPKSWAAWGQAEEPEYVNGSTSISCTYRTDKKGIAEIFKADLRPYFGYSSGKRSVSRKRAYIHTEIPERLRIDEPCIFAETDEHGVYKVTEWYSKTEQYAGKTWQEIEADIVAKYPEWVKHSIEFPYIARPEITVAGLKEYFDIKDHDKEESR